MTTDTPSRQGYFNANAPAFDSDGRPEASVDFLDPFEDEREPGDADQAVDTAQAAALRAIRSQSWHELMAAVAGRETDPLAIFHRFMYAMFVIGHPLAPRSYRSLAHYLRLPLSTVHYQVERLKAEFATLAVANRTEVEQ